MKKKLKLIEEQNLKFVCELPERLTRYDTTRSHIKIKYVNGEYQFVLPRLPQLFSYETLSIDELEAITDKLKKLNKQ